MHYLKDLVIAVQHALKDQPAAETPELEKALDAAVDFLTCAKTFEYTGEIGCVGARIILEDIKTDLDDVLKMLVGKKFDIKLAGELYLIKYDETQPAQATSDKSSELKAA
jgi:hypothetical protein